jgi:hypothetical protein
MPYSEFKNYFMLSYIIIQSAPVMTLDEVRSILTSAPGTVIEYASVSGVVAPVSSTLRSYIADSPVQAVVCFLYRACDRHRLESFLADHQNICHRARARVCPVHGELVRIFALHISYSIFPFTPRQAGRQAHSDPDCARCAVHDHKRTHVS